VALHEGSLVGQSRQFFRPVTKMSRT
jgi:hypothetical protein